MPHPPLYRQVNCLYVAGIETHKSFRRRDTKEEKRNRCRWELRPNFTFVHRPYRAGDNWRNEIKFFWTIVTETATAPPDGLLVLGARNVRNGDALIQFHPFPRLPSRFCPSVVRLISPSVSSLFSAVRSVFGDFCSSQFLSIGPGSGIVLVFN